MTEAYVRQKHFLYQLWSSMDAFYIFLYTLRSAARGGVPFWSDFKSGLDIMRSWEGPEVLIWAGLIVQVSVAVSCIGFYMGRKWAVYLAMIQLPLRYFFIVPSIPVILVLPMITDQVNNWIWGVLLVSSEVMKGWSLWWMRRKIIRP